MKTICYPFFQIVLFLGLMALAPSCSPKFCPDCLKQVKDLSVSLPAVMNLASKPYDDAAESKIAGVTKQLIDASAMAATFKRNKDLAEAYRILKDELTLPFFARWKEKGKLDKDYVKAAVMQVSDSLKAIEKAESAKQK
jgi:hypothetical protein